MTEGKHSASKVESAEDFRRERNKKLRSLLAIIAAALVAILLIASLLAPAAKSAPSNGALSIDSVHAWNVSSSNLPFGSSGATVNPAPPTEEPFMPIGMKENVTTFCDVQGGGAAMQFAGVAPHDGRYMVVIVVEKYFGSDVWMPIYNSRLFDTYLVQGEHVRYVEPVPEESRVRVSLTMPAQPDHGASLFTGEVIKRVPRCA